MTINYYLQKQVAHQIGSMGHSLLTPSLEEPFPYHLSGFPGGSEGKASACNAGDPGLIPGLGRSPGEGHGNPTSVFLPGESHEWRSLVSYICSPWGCRESDMTERLHFHFPLQPLREDSIPVEVERLP